MKTFFVNGQYVKEDQAVIPVTDLSVLRGYGVCDIIRTFKGKPLFLQEHITRLKKSALEIGLSIPWSEAQIVEYALETLNKNQFIGEVNIRIVITGGSSSDFFTPQGDPRLLILVTDLKTLPESWYDQGVKVITVFQERSIPEAKVTAYIPAALALKRARQSGAVEAVYINRDNRVLEGTTSNLFMIKNNLLITPDQDVLKGITRQAILKLAALFFPVQEKAVSLSELLEADEVFITGTNKGIVPVVDVDGRVIGTGKPGPGTVKLMKQLEQHTLEFSRKQ